MDAVKILIVDDEAYTLRMYREILSQHFSSGRIRTAHNGEKALKLLQTEEIDVMVTDIKMPEMDGLTLIKNTASIQDDIQIVVLTAYGDIDSVIESLRMGVNNYLTKPVSSEVLFMAVQNAWEKKKAVMDHRKAIHDLRESESKYRAMFEHMNDGVAVYKPVEDGNDFIFVDFNQAGELIEHLSKTEVIGQRVTAAFPGVAEMGLLDVFRRVWKTGGAEHLETTFYKDERIEGWRKNYVYKLPDGKIVAIYRDETSIKQTEEVHERLQAQLRQAQKLESIGTLAGGIAHDFNNILYPIIGYTEMTMEELPENSDLRENLNGVLKASYRARDLVQQILNFSRQTEEEYRPMKLQHIFKEVLQLLRATLPMTINVRTNIGKCGSVFANAHQMHQVMMNLSTNAYHAMADTGGTLDVSLTEETIGENTAAPCPEMEPGAYVALSVRDTGCGIDPVILDRIFDPYFTTKGRTKGTGLGLSVVHGIVKSHRGHIRVSSELNKGTRFDIYFPRIPEKSFEPVKQDNDIVPSGSETILLVDDEVQVITMLSSMLSRLGYSVITRISSLEALDFFKSRPQECDLVITDTTMPNMTGVELSRELIRIRPDIPIIICTGFSELISREKAREIGIRELIMKPVVRGEIGRTIRKILDDVQANRAPLG